MREGCYIAGLSRRQPVCPIWLAACFWLAHKLRMVRIWMAALGEEGNPIGTKSWKWETHRIWLQISAFKPWTNHTDVQNWCQHGSILKASLWMGKRNVPIQRNPVPNSGCNQTGKCMVNDYVCIFEQQWSPGIALIKCEWGSQIYWFSKSGSDTAPQGVFGHMLGWVATISGQHLPRFAVQGPGMWKGFAGISRWLQFRATSDGFS